MKNSAIIAALGLLAFAGVSAQAGNIVMDLSIVANPATQTWTAYGQIDGDTTRTLGLAGITFNVTGTGGITITNATNLDLPTNNNGNSGFIDFTSTGTNGVGIGGGQHTIAYTIKSGRLNVITGVGLTSGDLYTGDNEVIWAHPVKLADGTYTGNAGAINISATANYISFLPASLPTPNSNGVTITGIISPADLVNGGSVPISAIPEPASLAIIGLGAMGLLARRRRA